MINKMDVRIEYGCDETGKYTLVSKLLVEYVSFTRTVCFNQVCHRHNLGGMKFVNNIPYHEIIPFPQQNIMESLNFENL